jgi:8-oxo-dGTP diphosphatase
MNNVRRTASALLIDTEGRFLFQQRDDVPNILHPGKIGLFGGHREGAETALQCVCREVHEETGSQVPETAFQHLGSYKLIHPTEITIMSELFLARNIATDKLTITEGALLVASRADLPSLQARMTPATLYAVELVTKR